MKTNKDIFQTLFLASHSIKKKKEVFLLMAYHMNGKNKKGKFKIKWELIDKEKRSQERKLNVQLRREKVVSRLFKDEHDILKLGKKAI